MGVANLKQIEYWSWIVCFAIYRLFMRVYIYMLMDNVPYP